MENRIEPQDNKYFSIVHNAEKGCYDVIFKQASYDMSGELLGILSFIHQMGVNCPKDKLRFGAQIEQKSKIIQ